MLARSVCDCTNYSDARSSGFVCAVWSPILQLGAVQQCLCMAGRRAAPVQAQQGQVKQCLVCCCSYGQPNMVHSTSAQLQTLVLALTASFKAQGLFVVPQNVQLFDVWYRKLGLENAPTRRLQQQVWRSFRCSCSSVGMQAQGRWHDACRGSVLTAVPAVLMPADARQCIHGICSPS